MMDFFKNITDKVLSRRPMMEQPSFVKTEFTDSHFKETAYYTYLEDHQFELRFIGRVECRPEDLPHAKKNFKEQLHSKLYGDIIDDLREIQNQIYFLGDHKAITMMQRLFKKIYDAAE